MKYISNIKRQLIILILIFYSSVSFSGDLSKFEEDATKKEKSEKKESNKDCDADSKEACKIPSDFFSSIIDSFTIALADGVKDTLTRVQNDSVINPDSKLTKRVIGDPDIPYVAFDSNYLQPRNNVWGIENRAEFGYGPLGLQLKNIHYKESHPNDSLDITHIHALMRVSDGMFQLNFGLGAVQLDGEDHNTGFSTIIQSSFYPINFISLKLTAINSIISNNPISEYDGVVTFHYKYYGFNMGYKSNRTESTSIEELYLGVNFHY